LICLKREAHEGAGNSELLLLTGLDFKNVDENWQILALTRVAAGFWIFFLSWGWLLLFEQVNFDMFATLKVRKMQEIQSFMFRVTEQKDLSWAVLSVLVNMDLSQAHI
jgi:hypothetical protein